MDWILGIFIAFIVLLLTAIGVLIYQSVTSENIVLNKSEWECVEERTVMIPMGKSVMPLVQCIKYERR